MSLFVWNQKEKAAAKNKSEWNLWKTSALFWCLMCPVALMQTQYYKNTNTKENLVLTII